MLIDRTSQLAAALQRSTFDPLVVRIAGLIDDIEAGHITDSGAQTLLDSDRNLEPVRSLVSFEGATVNGNITISDIAGGHIFKITITHFEPSAPIDLVAARERLAELPTDIVPEVAPLPPGSRAIPINPNALFVGRTDELKQLAVMLKLGGAVVITTGIGGVGKTQIAAEFAHRYGRYFAGGVFWLSFADPAGIPGEIAACGGAGGMALYSNV